VRDSQTARVAGPDFEFHKNPATAQMGSSDFFTERRILMPITSVMWDRTDS